MTRDILLVGSIALANAEEVFRTVADVIGPAAKRIPDGETGTARAYWLQCQTPFFLDNPQLEMVERDAASPGGFRHARIPSNGLYSPTAAGAYMGQARLKPGVEPNDLRFDNLGYADWAEESFGIFKGLQKEGVVPAGAKFQVCIPTTQVVIYSRMVYQEIPKIAPAYEAGIFREVERICQNLPKNEVSIQWDCTEPVGWQDADEAMKTGMIKRMVSFAEPVADGVELGYHLCYGDWEHKHMREPDDLGESVEMANAVSSSVGREIGWMHMPVPRGRSDDAYFAPLKDLKLHPETELVLGLVHHTDGIDGTRRRMAAADKFVSGYGIATECGMGRRPPETIMELMRIHKQASEL
jgi:hypothetical protein